MVAIGASLAAPPSDGVRRARIRVGRASILLIAAIYFVGPLVAAFWFSIHGSSGLTWHAYTHMVSAPGFTSALAVSLELAAATVIVTVALMVPTMLLVHLRFPRVRILLEILCLFPLVVPPVVLVVGVSKVIAWGNNAPVDSVTGQAFNQLLNSHPPFVLALEYVVLVLPFSFRSIDAGLRASSITTLVEAARNLGAPWPTLVWRVVLPTLRTAVLNAAVLSFALVLGEFTMASILQYVTFPVWLLQFQNDDGQLSVALALMSLVLTWLVLIVFTLIAGRDPSARKATS